MAQMTKDVPNAPNVAIIAYPGVQQSAVFGLGDLFDVANRMVAEDTGPRLTHYVLKVADLTDREQFDAIIFPPNLIGARGSANDPACNWVRDQHRAGAIVCSACAGAYFLGYSGILDGRPVTTHWAFEADFKSTFPRINLYPEHILIDDNDIVTAGGIMAWVDLGIHVIGRWLGATVVSRTCRQMLIDPTGREQRNYRAFRPDMTHQDDAIRELQLWMEGNVNAEFSVASLADRAGLSKRSLQRRFEKHTGFTVTAYSQELRIEKAKGLLELTSLPVNEICWQVGYSDVSAFTRLFKSISGLTPGDYRRRFKVNSAERR